jgi:hypothetical protein
LHGITAEHVRDAPSWPQTLTDLVRFADGRPVVAHNAAFDLGVIREACTESDLAWPDLSYACTLVVARRTWSLLSYSLPWVAEAAGYRLDDHHDAGADALAAARIMTAAMRHHEVPTLSDLLQVVRVRIGELTAGSWRGCQHQGVSSRAALPDAYPEADPNGPFYGLAVCFTGTLSSMTRSQAWELVAEAGAQPARGVTRMTDLLVVGTQDPRRLTPGATLSGKQAKAMALLKDDTRSRSSPRPTSWSGWLPPRGSPRSRRPVVATGDRRNGSPGAGPAGGDDPPAVPTISSAVASTSAHGEPATGCCLLRGCTEG